MRSPWKNYWRILSNFLPYLLLYRLYIDIFFWFLKIALSTGVAQSHSTNSPFKLNCLKSTIWLFWASTNFTIHMWHPFPWALITGTDLHWSLLAHSNPLPNPRARVCVCVVSYHTPQLSAVHENCHHTADHRGGSTRTNRNLADRPAALWNLSENLFAGFWGILWAFFLLRSPPSQPFYLVIPHADTANIGRVKWSDCGEVLDCNL